MGRIKNKKLYPEDLNLTLDDYLVGSDEDSGGKTKNYPIRKVVELMNGAVILTVGNEVGEDWVEVASGKPVVANEGDLLFEYDTEQDIVLLKLARTPMTSLKFRVGDHHRNSDEEVNYWTRLHIDKTGVYDRQDVPITVPKLEVTIENHGDYESPRLVIERFRPKRHKGKFGRTKESKKFGRGSYKKEEIQLDNPLQDRKPNDIPMLEPINMVDLGAERYFGIRRNFEGNFKQYYRAGSSTSKSVRIVDKSATSPERLPTVKSSIRVHLEAKVSGVYQRVTQSYYLNLTISESNRMKGLKINIEEVHSTQ